MIAPALGLVNSNSIGDTNVSTPNKDSAIGVGGAGIGVNSDHETASGVGGTGIDITKYNKSKSMGVGGSSIGVVS